MRSEGCGMGGKRLLWVALAVMLVASLTTRSADAQPGEVRVESLDRIEDTRELIVIGRPTQQEMLVVNLARFEPRNTFIYQRDTGVLEPFGHDVWSASADLRYLVHRAPDAVIELAITDRQTGQMELLPTDFVHYIGSPSSISDDGRFVAGSPRVGSRDAVAVLDRNTGQVRLVANVDPEPSHEIGGAVLSGDGRFLFFDTPDFFDTGFGNAYRYELATSEYRQVNDNVPGFLNSASVSFDGRYVVYGSLARSFFRDMEAATSEVIVEAAGNASISGDGQLIVYAEEIDSAPRPEIWWPKTRHPQTQTSGICTLPISARRASRHRLRQDCCVMVK